MAPPLVPSQTVGPFFHDCMFRDPWNVLTGPETGGQRIRIEGQVYDGDGATVPDAMVEIWQADAAGHYRHPADDRQRSPDRGFIGFGRAGAERSGYWFETVKPGPVPWDSDSLQAPHINVQVFARGLLDHLNTRLYFEDEPANDSDPLLRSIPEQRRATLLAKRVGDDPVTYQFDIVLQGENETVFFAS